MENSEYSLQDFKKWQIVALKAYLSTLNLATKLHYKATLVARVFAAWEMNVSLAETFVET
jgi:hypothetical protein